MLDQRQFRNTMGLFATGVAVIAVPAGDEVQAMTANAVSSVSLEPLLLLFCPAKKAHLSQHLALAVPFSVNLLRADQVAISTYFAGAWREPVPPPFRFVRVGATPKLEGCLASLICSVPCMICSRAAARMNRCCSTGDATGGSISAPPARRRTWRP